MGTTIEDLVEITSMSDLDLLHARVVSGSQDNKISMENFIKLLPSIQTPVGDYIFSALSEDRSVEGLLIWAFDNAISQANYPALWNKLGHIFNEQHVSAGDVDLSDSETLFYPTPIPGGYQRIGTQDTAVINSTDDVDDSTELITLAIADYDALHMTRGVLGTGADGVPVRLKLVSGSLPTGLAEDTTYFINFGSTPDISLHATEEDAIANTSPINLTDAVGTFKITQEGIALDDAGHAHWHEFYNKDDASTAGGGKNTRLADTPSGVNNVQDPIADDKGNGTPRTTNETRPKTFISFGYIKAEHVTVSGDPVSALRDSQDWVEFTGDWKNKEFIITPAGAMGYSDIDDVYDLQVEIWLADDDTPTNPVIIKELIRVFDNSSPSNVDNIYGLSIMPNDASSFKLQTGSSGLDYMGLNGERVSLSTGSTGAYKVVITKPNLVVTYADTSFRKVYDISDATDVTHTLPDASTQLTEQIIKRRGSGAGKVIMATVSSQTIEGLTASIWELEGEGTIVLFPSGGNWEVKEYSDYGSNSNGNWEKLVNGKLVETGIKNVSSLTGPTLVYPKTFIALPAFVPNIHIGSTNKGILTTNATTSQIQTNFISYITGLGSAAGTDTFMYWLATGRWRT